MLRTTHLRNSARKLWRTAWPKKREIEPCLREWLEHTFPGLDPDRVRFCEGLPDVVNLAGPRAITLPSLLGTRRIHVYYRRRHNPSTCEGLRLIAHEMVHVRQYLDYAGGYGLGFARAFLPLYLLCWLRHGYRNSPLEEEAYEFDRRIRSRCRESIQPCRESNHQGEPHTSAAVIEPENTPAEIPERPLEWNPTDGHPVMHRTSVDFLHHLWYCLPGMERFSRHRLLRWTMGIVYWAPAMALLLAVVLIITLLWPVVRLVWMAVVAGWSTLLGALSLFTIPRSDKARSHRSADSP